MMRRVGHNDKLKFCSPGGPVSQLCRNNATYCPREDDGWQSDTIGIIEAMTGPFEWRMNAERFKARTSSSQRNKTTACQSLCALTQQKLIY